MAVEQRVARGGRCCAGVGQGLGVAVYFGVKERQAADASGTTPPIFALQKSPPLTRGGEEPAVEQGG